MKGIIGVRTVDGVLHEIKKVSFYKGYIMFKEASFTSIVPTYRVEYIDYLEGVLEFSERNGEVILEELKILE